MNVFGLCEAPLTQRKRIENGLQYGFVYEFLNNSARLCGLMIQLMMIQLMIQLTFYVVFISFRLLASLESSSYAFYSIVQRVDSFARFIR